MVFRLGSRFVHSAILLFCISILGFALLRMLPGDYAEIILLSQMDGTLPDAAQVQRFAADNGLNDPLPAQYVRWLWDFIQGDWGRSLVTGGAVSGEIALRVQKSLILAVASVGVAMLLALPAGVLCALYPGGKVDRLCSLLSVLGMSVPNFWLALLLTLFFSLTLGWLPTSGHQTVAHAVLPTLVIATSMMGVLTRFIRNSLLDEFGENYIRTAKAKGAARFRILTGHIRPNIIPGFLTLTGMQFARVFDGMIVVETLFGWPGLGRLLVESLLSRDYLLIQACLLVIAVGYVLINLLVDTAIAVYDPRARGII